MSVVSVHPSAKYINLEQSLTINYDLRAIAQKLLTGNNVSIFKTLDD